jgi:hypothetical protein
VTKPVFLNRTDNYYQIWFSVQTGRVCKQRKTILNIIMKSELLEDKEKAREEGRKHKKEKENEKE